jgi:hypothetical protein
MATVILIGCSLPNGLVITDANGRTVTLNGRGPTPVNTGTVGGGFTEIDEAFWAAWSAYGLGHELVEQGIVWEA